MSKMEYERNRRNYKLLEEMGIYVNKPTIDRTNKRIPKILFVEDEVICIKLPVEWLNRFGFKGCFDIATNGKIALEMFMENGYDLVITDIGMPIMDGIELIKSIRKEEKRHTPIIALTGFTEREKQLCIDAKCDIALLKTGCFDELEEAIFSSLFDFYENLRKGSENVEDYKG